MKKHRYIGWGLFIGYLIVLAYLTFFSELMGRTVIHEYPRMNLVPMREIMRFIGMWERPFYRMAVILNLVGNVAAFMPFGFALPHLFRGSGKWYCILVAAFLLSLLIECMQLLFMVGTFDVDDLLLNTVGGMAGYLVYCLTKRWQQRRKD